MRRAYRTTIREAERPWFFLYLDLPGGQVDVNVHPAKLEVRFRDRTAVEGFIEEEVRRALAGEESAATLDSATAGNEGEASSTGDRAPGSFPGPTNGEGAPADRVRESAEYAPGTPGRFILRFILRSRQGADRALREWSAGGCRCSRTRHGGPRKSPSNRRASGSCTGPTSSPRCAGGMMMIDQHSAHERILFQELMEAFGKGGQPGQRLLFPITMTLPPAEYQHIEPLFGMLRRAGFEVDGFRGATRSSCTRFPTRIRTSTPSAVCAR